MTEHQEPAGAGTDDGHEPDRAGDERCPSCGALRPPSVGWCTQCYARFEPAEPVGGERGLGAADEKPPVTGAGAQVPGLGLGPADPVRDHAGAPLDPDELEARAQELLVRLSAEGGGEDRVRSWSGRVRGRGPKVGLVVLGTSALTALLFGTMAVLGALL